MDSDDMFKSDSSQLSGDVDVKIEVEEQSEPEAVEEDSECDCKPITDGDLFQAMDYSIEELNNEI